MSQPLPLSGVVITKNEADRIARCVSSMTALCSEVIVLDAAIDECVLRDRGQPIGTANRRAWWLLDISAISPKCLPTR